MTSMFTGLVQAVGRVVSITPRDAGAVLKIDRSSWKNPGVVIAHGDSICVNGVCLTVTAFDDATLSFDVVKETLAVTTLADLRQGDEVNLEPSLTPSTPMGGHFVQGHVDGVAVIEAIRQLPGEWRVTFRPPVQLMDYIVPKGSVTLHGISLTIASVTDSTFDIALIPTTLAMTTMGKAKAGDKVNLETDIISRTIVHHLNRMSGKAARAGLTMDILRQAGFETA